MKRLLIFGIGGFVILILVILGIRYFLMPKSTDCENARIYTSKDTLIAGETLQFADSTEGSESWLWDIGYNNTTFNEKSGSFSYDEPGEYTITLIVNGKCELKKLLAVIEPVEVKAAYTPKIIGPEYGEINKPIKFRTENEGASSYKWSFGEKGGDIDSRDADPTYTYSVASTYTITLQVNNTTQTAIKKIRITSPPIKKDAPGMPSEAIIKNHLVSIAQGKYNEHYSILLKLLGNNPSLPIMVKKPEGDIEKTLFLYCRELGLVGKSVKINNVKYIFDKGVLSQIIVSQTNI